MANVDDDKELAKLLTGYQDMVGLLNVHKATRPNTQVLEPFLIISIIHNYNFILLSQC